jgi:hypothetical protein
MGKDKLKKLAIVYLFVTLMVIFYAWEVHI